jgi:hypothetical protein
MTKILSPRVEMVAGQSVCLCGEPECAELLATIIEAESGQGRALVLPALITEVGIIKGVKRYARDMAQEFRELDPTAHLELGVSDLPIVVVCPASHQENFIATEILTGALR